MFNVGDRVKIYGNTGENKEYDFELYLRGEVGEVTSITADDEISVLILNKRYGVVTVHPKQCRKIKVKVCSKCGQKRK